MVIDSLNLDLRQILPIYLRLSGNVPPHSEEQAIYIAFMLWVIKFVIPSKENDEQFKSNLKNFYLLKNTSSCLHGSR